MASSTTLEELVSRMRERGSQAEQQDTGDSSFFELDMPILEFAYKDDIESMESPFFTLSTKPDTSVFRWTSPDGNKTIVVSPSAEVGRATIFDKDVLIFCISQIVAAFNAKKTPQRRVRFVVADFLRATGRGTSGDDYARFADTMARLHGTTIRVTGKGESERRSRGFGLIDAWEVVETAGEGKRRMARVECTISAALFEAIKNRKILTISPDYFKLRRPIERRLYEVARKHCGSQPEWKVTLSVLKDKCGSKSELKRFRLEMRNLCKEQTLPDYQMRLEDGDIVVFNPKGS